MAREKGVFEKGNCESCSQRIQNTVFDKCMYCGALLPEHQRFSDSEKEEVLAQLKKADLDDFNARQSRLSDSSRSYSLDIDFGSDGWPFD